MKWLLAFLTVFLFHSIIIGQDDVFNILAEYNKKHQLIQGVKRIYETTYGTKDPNWKGGTPVDTIIQINGVDVDLWIGETCVMDFPIYTNQIKAHFSPDGNQKMKFTTFFKPNGQKEKEILEMDKRVRDLNYEIVYHYDSLNRITKISRFNPFNGSILSESEISYRKDGWPNSMEILTSRGSKRVKAAQFGDTLRYFFGGSGNEFIEVVSNDSCDCFQYTHYVNVNKSRIPEILSIYNRDSSGNVLMERRYLAGSDLILSDREYTYDSLGRISVIKDNNFNYIDFNEYDDLGNLTKEILPYIKRNYIYDENGNCIKILEYSYSGPDSEDLNIVKERKVIYE